MNRLKIVRFIEEIVLVINLYEFMEELEFFWKKLIEGVSYFDNMVNFFILLLKWIFIDLINKV